MDINAILTAINDMLNNGGAIWVVAVVALGIIVNRVTLFIKLSKAQQLAKVKECLLNWVVYAEKELGSGTGQVKLSAVYGMFVQAFPVFKNFITVDVFNSMVDEALKQMRDMLDDGVLGDAMQNSITTQLTNMAQVVAGTSEKLNTILESSKLTETPKG